MPLRIIVGPTAMYVERHGIRSAVAPIGAEHGAADVRSIAQDLWQSIRRPVSWRVWLYHRLTMSRQRHAVAIVRRQWPADRYHPGPRPDLVAILPWKEVRWGHWASLPPGIVHRLIAATEGDPS